jgi:hypothetical protein
VVRYYGHKYPNAHRFGRVDIVRQRRKELDQSDYVFGVLGTVLILTGVGYAFMRWPDKRDRVLALTAVAAGLSMVAPVVTSSWAAKFSLRMIALAGLVMVCKQVLNDRASAQGKK